MPTAVQAQTSSLRSSLVVARAWSDDDYEQIAKLNHDTFTHEIPQHAPREDGLLVDSRLRHSACFVAKRQDRVVGMLALSRQRPFSLDSKLDDLDQYLPDHLRENTALCEVRLLAIAPDERGKTVLAGLLRAVLQHAREQRLEAAVISGTTRQLRLYRRFGFQAFGPCLGTAAAPYQGMIVDWSTLGAGGRKLAPPSASASNRQPDQRRTNLLPGPVSIHPAVERALREPSLSHRGVQFQRLFEDVRHRLRKLTQAQEVQVFPGSGTLANDMVAAQLSTLDGPGLVVNSGEFGQRLLAHAQGARLSHETFTSPYGQDLDYAALESRLRENPDLRWLWLTHCETSSGVMHHLTRLLEVCQRTEVKLAVDCISSIGVAPLDLSSVFLATATSGKALGAFAGLGAVFHQTALAPARAPRVLTLASYAQADGVPFTISTNLVRALDAALQRLRDHPLEARLEERQRAAERLRAALRSRGFGVVAPDECASPAVTTVQLPQRFSSQAVGDALFDHGYRVSYQSRYLCAKNEIQFCCMGEQVPAEIEGLPDLLAKICADLRWSEPAPA